MSLGMFEILALVGFTCASATFNFPELNPDLGKYQDSSTVYPLIEPFYEIYRNYEEDPIYGVSKCVKVSQVGEEDGVYKVLAEFGENQTALAMVTLESSEGYSEKNMIVFSVNGGDETLPIYLTYLDVESCGVLRIAYVSESACGVVVPESRIGQSTLSCDFVYDLLCGTTRYQIYDDSCKN
ncbi:uncharacterized protein LOC121833571 [Ixodes scapularis]|uniref:uncharacterized protein LOC121833571 n=1 Tax=Ixodes scapularis TaxID=6945 RepID=UPI001C38BA6A|nr:uncharacterized protein LOC121833571 [Ixodes scapularis]